MRKQIIDVFVCWRKRGLKHEHETCRRGVVIKGQETNVFLASIPFSDFTPDFRWSKKYLHDNAWDVILSTVKSARVPWMLVHLLRRNHERVICDFNFFELWVMNSDDTQYMKKKCTRNGERWKQAHRARHIVKVKTCPFFAITGRSV